MKKFIYVLMSCFFSQFIFCSDSSTEEFFEEAREPELFYQVGTSSKQNTMTGKYAHDNEDRYVVKSIKYAFDKPDQSAAFFGVFDGHGGHDVSDFLRDHIVNIFLGAVSTAKTVFKAIENTFETVDRQARALRTKQGSTAAVSVICNNKIYLANAGDSVAIAVLRKDNRYYYKDTIDHKPSNKNEADRIQQAGGFITKNGSVARVGRNLSLSRSIGDHPKELGLIATPDIKWLELNNTFRALILVSDGVTDVMTREDIVNEVLDAFHDGKSADEAAQIIVEEAARRGSKDDITALVVKFLYGVNKPEEATTLESPFSNYDVKRSLKRKRTDIKKTPAKRVKKESPGKAKTS